MRDRDTVVILQALHHLFLRDLVLQLQMEPHRMHILRVDFDCGGKQVQVHVHGFKKLVRVPSVVRTEPRFLVAVHLRRRDKIAVLADIVRPSNANELRGI